MIAEKSVSGDNVTAAVLTVCKIDSLYAIESSNFSIGQGFNSGNENLSIKNVILYDGAFLSVNDMKGQRSNAVRFV
jgi:hypothetical protein